MTEGKVKPKVSTSLAQQELDKAEKQFEAFDENVKSLTLDRMNATPKEETEPQTKISQKEISESKDIYLKPKRTLSCRAKFNERLRSKYEYDKEYVFFIAEHKEMPGETLELWTKPYAGVPYEEWVVPTNKPVWAPRYLAEQIKRKYYHRLMMQQNTITAADGMGQYYGQLAVDTTVPRLDARPATKKRSIFLGASSF